MSVIGVIYADNSIRTGAFSERDLGVLTTFADQAAFALDNANLFECEQRSREELTKAYDATLQGGMLNRSSPYIVPPDDMTRWLGKLEASLTLELYRHQLEFYTQISSPKFQLAEPHGWMGIAYKYWF